MKVNGQLVRQARPSPARLAGVAGCSMGKPTSLPNARRNQLLDDVPAHPSFLQVQNEELLAATGLDRTAAGLRLDASSEIHPRERTPLLARDAPGHELGQLLWREEGMFAVQLNEPPAPPGQKHPDYYANVGTAIRTLRDDIPHLFYKDLDCELIDMFWIFLRWNDNSRISDLSPIIAACASADSIYREDIVFRDPNLNFKGMKNYQLIFWSLRFHGRLFFTRMYVDVLRIWQPEDRQIRMRWRVRGIPRVWWEAEGTLDGISTYKLDSEGMIYEHSVDNVQLRDPPITNPLLYGLNYILAPRMQPQAQPCPGSWITDADLDLHNVVRFDR